MPDFSECFRTAPEAGTEAGTGPRVGAASNPASSPREAARRLERAGTAAWKAARPGTARRLFARAEAALAGEDAPGLLSAIRLSHGLCLYDAGEDAAALRKYRASEAGDPGDDPVRRMIRDRRIAGVLIDDGDFAAAEAQLGPPPPVGTDPVHVFAWTNVKMLIAERTGRIDDGLSLAGEIRDLWAAHGYLPRFRALAGGVVSALRVRATLKGPEVTDALYREIAALRVEGLSLNARLRLGLLRARLAETDGDVRGALRDLDGLVSDCIAEYGEPPLDLLVAQHDILIAAGRGHEVFDLMDRQTGGLLSAQTLRIDRLTAEHAEFVLLLTEIADLPSRAPRLWSDLLPRAVALALTDTVAVEPRWQLCLQLSILLASRRSAALLAKVACRIVREASATGPMFPLVRRRYAARRMAPFERAVDLLFDDGRLREARTLLNLATGLRRAQVLAVPALSGERPLADPIPWTPEERAILSRIATDPSMAQGLVDGGIWSARPSLPAPTPATGPPGGTAILRYARGACGTLLDAVTPAGTRRLRLPLPDGEICEALADLLAAAERAEHDASAAERLRGALLAPVADLIDGARSVAILADGVVAGVPFDLLAPVGDPHWLHLRRLGSAAGPLTAPTRAVLVADSGLDGVVAEAAALAAHYPLSRHPLSETGLLAALRAPGDLLHVSGHFDVPGGDPGRMALRVSDGRPLTCASLAEMLRQAPPPPLVCLSLCESAAFDPVVGEAYDLPGLFLAAGAVAVVATAWRIRDDEAARFATAFYPALARTGCARAAFAECGPAARGFKLFLSGVPDGE